MSKITRVINRYRDLAITGRDIAITAAENSHTSLTQRESRASGLTLALSGTAGSALNTAIQQTREATREMDSRMATLMGIRAALTGVGSGQALALDMAKGSGDGSNNNTVGISLTYGRQKSTSEQRVEQHRASGSTLTAGRDMVLTATEGDVWIQGAQFQAGRDTVLDAARDLRLESARNTETTSGRSDSHGGSLGIGIGVGQGGANISISGSVSASRGRENGSSLTYSETTISSGRDVMLRSGQDTTLTGAQISGDRIMGDIGRNLTITSEQDRDRYDSQHRSTSAGATVSYGTGGWSGSASFNASRDKLHGNFDSVAEQSGLFAGEGGFDIRVGEHTQLNGGVIGSTATADRNRLETGTLSFEDIQNRADFKAEHQSVGISTGSPIGGQFMGNLANSMLTGASREGHASSVTRAGVSDGNIVIRDQENQQQDIATLNRDTTQGANGLSPIFDKEKEQQRLRQARLLG